MKKPCICIGREYGSGGREIGAKISKRLKCMCYDKLLMRLASEKSGVSIDTVEEQEEKTLKGNEFLSGNVFADSIGIANSFYMVNHSLYETERDIILNQAKQGQAVFIGRCASDILKEQERLSVFIYGNEEDKINRIAQRNNISLMEAEVRRRRIDRLRKQHFDFYAETRWGRTESYDLMISSSVYGIDGCVDIIAEAVKKWEAYHE